MSDSPCQPWITGDDLACDGDADELDSAARAASDLMYVASGRQFVGECDALVYPGARCGCLCDAWDYPHPYMWDHSRWRGRGRWRTGRPWRTQLGYEPITDVVSVVIGGVAIDPSEYVVEDGVWLVRVSCAAWPCTGDWSADISYGTAPPEAGIRAAKALGCELVKLATTGECDLPENAQNYARQGVSATFDVSVVDPDGDFVTGLREVDLFLRTYNPEDLRGGVVVGLPGAHEQREVTWP